MKTCGVLIGAASILCCTSIYAQTVTLSELVPNAGNAFGGGIFQAVTSANGTFDTFCMSITTEFNNGGTYNYSVSPTISANNVPPVPSYVTLGTAYLYSQFLQGTYGAANSANSAELNALQATIWYLQGNLSLTAGGSATATPGSGTFVPGQSGNSGDVSAEITAIWATLPSAIQANAVNPSNGAYGVEAMNLYSYDANGGLIKNQPQLIEVPEASTVIAGALLMLPLGLSALRIVRKNRVA